ncbi:hypothetical protein DFQ30_010352 [Apophysomyces sp. BC1015]|nr:hypothetical protein DFQ30_010352 [Apophysomyces sp. BC1015]KAG0183554.1 hypothetical protein DFQ29_002609 [Apophysomyces sp. BC1021]
MEPTHDQSLQLIIDRLAQLENRVSNSVFFQDDPNVVIRHSGADLHPSPQVLQAFPAMEQDFFRSKLDDVDRRKFLFDCPKNDCHNYDPPVLNQVSSLSGSVAKMDSNLRQIQNRLSGLTRPLGWFAY